MQVTLDAMPGQTFSAKVVRVYPYLDQAMRTRTVEAKLTEPVEPAPGMFARLSLTLQEADNAVLVPAEAVLTAPTGGLFIFVVDQGKAHRRDVGIGIHQERMVQAIRGVEPGERVVVAGQAALRDGQAVRLPGQSKPSGGDPSIGKRRSSTLPAPGKGAGQ